MKILPLLALVPILASPVLATWSLGLLDPQTKSIVVAAASCSFSVYGVAGVVPGKGLVYAQAESNMRAKQKALEAMRGGTRVADILHSITTHDFDPRNAYQQYALLTFSEISSPVTFTGEQTPPWHGAFSSEGVTVQGNTLVSPEVLRATYNALRRGAWQNDTELAEVALAALSAGASEGGDSRCGAATASSAFVTVVRARDDIRTPYLNLVVRKSDSNGSNAVTLLQRRFDEWKAHPQPGKP